MCLGVVLRNFSACSEILGCLFFQFLPGSSLAIQSGVVWFALGSNSMSQTQFLHLWARFSLSKLLSLLVVLQNSLALEQQPAKCMCRIILKPHSTSNCWIVLCLMKFALGMVVRAMGSGSSMLPCLRCSVVWRSNASCWDFASLSSFAEFMRTKSQSS